MKKILILSAVILLCIACQKDQSVAEDYQMSHSLSTITEAQETFAQILSRAVSDDSDLRSFIKEEAMKQYDNDYDIFYPWVKETIIGNGQSVRQSLLKYTDENTLQNIESLLPKLTILVPDYSWCECFSIKDWNESDPDVCVTHEHSNDNERIIFSKGEQIGKLESGEFPDFPLLIVKENERMKVIATKANGLSYDYVDDVFNGSYNNIDTRVSSDYYDRYIQVEDTDNFMPSYMIPSEVITASRYFYASQRDYVYYGMTSAKTTGELNTNAREVIHKFKLTSNASMAFYSERGDASVNTGDWYGEFYKKEQSDDFLIKNFLINGRFEFYFNIFIANKNGTVSQSKKLISRDAKDLFQLSKVNVNYKHATWVSKAKRAYKVNLSCFTPKWCVIDLELPRWDISNASSVFTINISEYDDGTITERSASTKESYSSNFSFSAEGTIKIVKLSLGVQLSSTVTNEKQVKYTTTDASDDLATIDVDYTDPIILNKRVKNGVSGYNVRTISSGEVEMMIIPELI